MPIKEVVRGQWVPKVENMEEKANTAYTKATLFLRTVIKCLEEKSLTEEQWAWLNKYFLLADTNRDVPGELVKVLTNTLNGMETTQITLKIEYFNVTKKSQGSTISIALAQYNKPNQIIRYLLHESSHCFAGTDDSGDRGYINNDGSFRQQGLAPNEAINNADSFAVFVVLFNNIPLV